MTTMAVGDCNENGVPTSTGRVAIGAVGSVTFVDEACTLAIDATLFFLTDSGEVDAVRLLAPNVPATGGPLPPCR